MRPLSTINAANNASATVPGLVRGLRLIRHLLLAGQPVRFKDLRPVLPGVPDSTLTRLLKSLEEHGYLVSHPRDGYSPGPELAEWQRSLRETRPSRSEMLARTVTRLAGRTNESAAFALLEGDHISISASRTVFGAVSVIPAGSVLHFEADHAAALAILSQLSGTERRRHLRGPTSRIADEATCRQATEACSLGDGLYMDASRERPGICRLAAALPVDGQPGALFLCLTRQRAEEAREALLALLREERDALKQSLI